MEFSIKQIADFLNAEIVGDATLKLNNLSKIEEGVPGTLTFLSNPKYTNYIYTTKASACLVSRDFVPEKPLETTLIKVDNPYECLAKLLSLVEGYKKGNKRGVHPSAIIDPSASIGEDVYIGAYAVIEAGVKIGANSKIYPHTFLDNNVVIGENTTLYSGVKVYDGCVIGKNCILQSGAVIGADGFGFAPDAQGVYNKIPQIGNVLIEDDVEVGANTTIDRATMGSTIIRKGVKLDNQIQIAHNVEVGTNTVMAAQSGVAGSTKIGESCMVGGQCGFAGHINIAPKCGFGAKSGIHNTIKEGGFYQGYPAMTVGQFRRLSVIQKQLPDIVKRVYELDKKIK